MSKTPSRCTSYSRLFSIVDYFSTRPRMPTQADRASIDSIGSLLAWMLNPLINMILMHPGGGEQLPMRYPAVYATVADANARNASLSAVSVQPSPLSGTRRIVDIVFSYRNRQTDVVEKYFVRVDVTEEFPFLVTRCRRTSIVRGFCYTVGEVLGC